MPPEWIKPPIRVIDHYKERKDWPVVGCPGLPFPAQFLTEETPYISIKEARQVITAPILQNRSSLDYLIPIIINETMTEGIGITGEHDHDLKHKQKEFL